mgnify:CR=1 FL=1
MEKKDWLELDFTKKLVVFINTELKDLAIGASEGRFIDRENADVTQYQHGVCMGNVGAYQLVKDFIFTEDQDAA